MTSPHLGMKVHMGVTGQAGRARWLTVLMALTVGSAVVAGCSGPDAAVAARPVASGHHPARAHHQAAAHHKAAAHHQAGVHHAAAASTKGGKSARGPAFFRTLPPGAKLPGSAQCAAWVRARPMAENKGVNQPFNQRTGHSVGQHFFSGDTPAANEQIAPRINGDFTGTTEEILRWAACKWGINQDIVFAQAAKESWWRQDTEGDFHADPALCPPGHRQLNAQGQCAQSYGILQNRYPYEQSSWPGIGRSTAMNADTAYAIWRTCYNGDEVWLNTVPETRPYQKGDVWGCVGRWFSGRWHDARAQQYIALVQNYLRKRIWTTSDFQQP